MISKTTFRSLLNKTATQRVLQLPTWQLSTIKRYNCLKRRLKNDKALLDKYNKTFNDYLNDDIIEKVDVSKDDPGFRKVHSLPHHPVIKLDHEQLRVRSHEWGNELKPVWHFKLAWEQVLFTWHFISVAFQNDPIFW